jgi:4-alpha-glucanotransferase
VIPRRCAGILIPLFALRSAGDYGRGDIGGLTGIGDLALAMGQQLIQLLPIDETPPGEASPYSAMSVLAIDPRYIATALLPGGDAGRGGVAAGATLDPAQLSTVKDALLRSAFQQFKDHAASEARSTLAVFAVANRGWLDDYALFRALQDHFREADWRRWPESLRSRDAQATADAQRAHAEAIEYFRFVQYVAHTQWSDAREKLRRRGIYLGGDLAFSPSGGSVEVWAHQAMFDATRLVGAPPDAFSATGQRWGLPMPDWAGMRASGFAFLRTRVRRARELYDFLRVDHVVGLFRTFGYPLGENTTGAFDPPSEDAQLAQGEEILRVILEEAGPLQIIGEDLGVIPPFVRGTLTRLGIPGYKIARWEREWSVPTAPFIPPSGYPELALATTGTHDTETFAEWWETAGEQERRQFLEGMGIRDGSIVNQPSMTIDALDRVLEAIYASPAAIAIMPFQDLFGWKDRINVPGTVAVTNWRWRLPFDPARAVDDPEIRRRAAAIRGIAVRTRRFPAPN